MEQHSKELLESRKTQRQNVSYYFSNNDQKLIPQRRTNYLIGAQSTSLPLVTAALGQQQSMTGILSSHNNTFTTTFQRPAAPTTAATHMRGTLEYNQ